MKKIIALIIILAGLGMGFFVIPNLLESASLNDLSEKIIGGDEDAVTEKLQEVAELSTVEYDYSNAVNLKDNKKLFNNLRIPFTSKEIVMTYDGKIKMGINGKNLKVKDINKSISGEVESIAISIPKIGITSHEIDRNTVDFPVEESPIFNKATNKDFDKIESTGRNEIEKAAMRSEAMDIAKKNLKDSLKGYVKGLYGTDVNVEFEEE